jgi:glycosyltransferase involved in cell wall biosynthesis
MGKAFLWSADDDGSGWYRTRLVAEALNTAGHDVKAGRVFDPAYADADVILGQRVCTTGASATWARWVTEGKRLVFDADDDYFHIDPANAKAHAFYSGTNIRTRLAANAGMADVVTVCSPRLAEVFAEFSDRVVVVPNGLPAALLDRPRRFNRSATVVGWVGTESTVHELPIVQELLAIVAGLPGVSVHTVGLPWQQMRRLGLSGPGISSTGWVQNGQPYLDAIDFDIWLAPYRPTAHNEAKAPTKALEAAFLGIPVIASGIGPYRDFVQDGKSGLIADSAKEWFEALTSLIEDWEGRQRMGEYARRVARGHTVESLVPAWESALFGGAA